MEEGTEKQTGEDSMTTHKRKHPHASSPSSASKKTKSACTHCAQEGHHNIYSPECPLHIPVHARARCTVVKVSVVQRVRSREVLPVLEEACDRFSKLVYRAHLLILAHATRMLSCNKTPPAIDKRYLSSVLACLKKNKNKQKDDAPTKPSEDLLETCRQILKESDKVDTTGLSGVIDANMELVLTPYKNFDALALESHVAKYVRALYDIKRGHGSSVADKVCRDKKEGYFETLPKTLQGTCEYWNEQVQNLHAHYHMCTAQGDSSMYQIYRYFMMSKIQEKNEELLCGGVQEYSFKQIPLLPVRREGRQFITLDDRSVSTLNALAKQVLPNHDEGVLRGLFTSLDTLFIRQGSTPAHMCPHSGKMQKGSRMRKNPAKWRLAPSVKTNGIELHVLFDSVNTRRKGKDGVSGRIQHQPGHKVCTKDLDPSYDFTTVPRGIQPWEIRVLDPGTNVPFTSGQVVAHPTNPAEPKKNLRHGTVQFKHQVLSKGWYNKISKRNKMKRKEERDRKRYRMDHALETLSRNSLRTPHWDALRRAIRVRLDLHDTLHRHYSRKQRLKLKFEVKMAQERAIHETIDFLRGKKNPLTGETYSNPARLVVVGDGGRMSGLRGTTCSAPMAKIKRLAVRRARVEGWHFRVINEAYTSARSYCCAGHDMENILTAHKTHERSSGGTSRTRVHGISRCTNENCLTLWNRDKAATCNQWCIAASAYAGVDRPWWTTKENTPPENQQNCQPMPCAILYGNLYRV
jgi:hypothetical protein